MSIDEIEKNGGSILPDENWEMGRKRRAIEQEGNRRFARVNEREHKDPEENSGLENSHQNGPLQHPYLNTQRLDGADNNVSPEPSLTDESRREFDNERREQEMAKQHRLGNMPKFSSAPKPHGPS